LISYSENAQIREKGGKILKIMTPLHLLYVLIIIFGYLKLSKCTEESAYPLSFVLGDVLFFISFLASMRLK
jgi:hypothetical protein